jgi:hypothetical protein
MLNRIDVMKTAKVEYCSQRVLTARRGRGKDEDSDNNRWLAIFGNGLSC